MSNLSLNNNLLPNIGTQEEVIYLESEHFERAIEIRNQFIRPLWELDTNHDIFISSEEEQWRVYIKVLALCSFEGWLSAQVGDLLINPNYRELSNSQVPLESTALCYLKVGDFDICLIVTENFDREIIIVPKRVINLPDYVAHFYVVIEILEEQEEAIIKGCLRYDRIINYQQSGNALTERDGNYQIPLSLFDPEANHFLSALQFLSSTAIIPIFSPTANLSNWLANIFETTWMAIEDLLNAEILRRTIVCPVAVMRNRQEEIAELINQIFSLTNEFKRHNAIKRLGSIAQGNDSAIAALINLLQTTQDDETLWIIVDSLWQISPGNPEAGVRRVKLIDLGMEVSGETVALSVAMIKKSPQQFGVLLRVYPTNDQLHLPANLRLLLLDNSGELIHEVRARNLDNYIQLRFNVQTGENFSVSIAVDDSRITEHFEI
jgi:Protein of unknown function (DUF1822)